MFNKVLPHLYRRLRKRAGLSQVQLAAQLDITRNTVSNYESGATRPDPRREQKLVELAACSDEEATELFCERLSEILHRRVAIVEDRPEYEPATALGRARRLLRGSRAELPDALQRALANKINTTELLGLAFERLCADLEDLLLDCQSTVRKEQPP